MRCRSYRAQVVCRDIWALHLSLLPNPPPPEPFYHAQSQYGGASSGAPPPDSTKSQAQAASKVSITAAGAEDLEKDDVESEASSSSSSEDEGDPDMDRLLRENSIGPSSSSSSEDEANGPRKADLQQTRKTKLANRPYESPMANISILMLACWMLRLPMMYMDFKRYAVWQMHNQCSNCYSRLIESYDLPYLDPLRFLPENMTLHLTKHMVKALSPQPYHRRRSLQ